MMRAFVAAAALLLLASCGSVPEQDIAGCVVTLVASGQRDAAGLLQAAQLSPACARLEEAAVRAALAEAMKRIGK